MSMKAIQHEIFGMGRARSLHNVQLQDDSMQAQMVVISTETERLGRWKRQ